MQPTSSYIGRFAPSPSGPLHMGSLVTALGGFLQAKVHNGIWRLRIDDIDPPRIVPGAVESIQSSLIAHGLLWQDEVVMQSHNQQRYQKALHQLSESGLVYFCECTRQQIKAKGPYYAGTCKYKTNLTPPYSVRFNNPGGVCSIEDNRLGTVSTDPVATGEDFIVKRKDGLYAYHLASVADDIAMGITEIVRGEDLLLPTACQWSLFRALQKTPPQCMHLPLVTFADGRKFSKQNYAPALDNNCAAQNLTEALSYLNLQVPVEIVHSGVNEVLHWAIEKWHTKHFC
ncbi:tRNA glutamyl-Q(34) synthetase GluQRS [Aliiglaciecola sp. LCG003]|uniref:tRNA glutamyl-Q(34) synthetase GluQRS n=1 Tax=Aliiglaciecola sp. LCG003 TaxID=3053655 RepID=UPI002573D28F|nr:tRNA glutamyl-Q(34) synthetase GluQRS [Aliiglaciecola sp. LCG003]WJG09144.1 tRNA glutamyl-Q(34) synthetase GluQRS [Aliiglaciecola sp. LCG003]